jgi:hypothetical protein
MTLFFLHSRLPLVVSSLLLLCHSFSSAHTTRGHNVIEAAAYKALLKKPKGEIPGYPQYTGKEVLQYLIAQHILRVPPCYPVDGHMDPDCLEYEHEDSLVWLPIIGSGDMDAIFYRQFSENGQNFHFMATPDDVFLDTRVDEHTHVPVGLSQRAYPRSIKAMSGTFYDVLFSRFEARENYRNIYSLIHTIGDSYSEAHAQRDPTDWSIDYLKPWQATAWEPYLFYWSGWQYFFGDSHHGFPTDDRDKQYFNADSVHHEEMDFFDRNPYLVPRAHLSERGIRAANAVEDLLVTTFRVLKRGEDEGGDLPAIATFEWRAFLKRNFMSSTETGVIDTLEVAPQAFGEREWRPLTLIGMRTRSGSLPGAMDAVIGTTFGKPPNRLDPFAFAAGFEIGRRFYQKETHWIAALSFSTYLWVYSDKLAYGFDPTVAEATLVGRKIEVDPLMSFLRFDIYLWHRMWISLEGPRYSFIHGFRKNEFSLTLGLTFSKELIPAHSPRTEDLMHYSPSLAGGGWIVPDVDSPRRLGLGNFAIFYPFGYSFHNEGRHNSLHPFGYAFIWNLDKAARRAQLELGVYVGPGFEFFHDQSWGFVTLSPLVRYKLTPMFAMLLEPLQTKGRVGLSSATGESVDVYGTIGALIVFGSLEIGIDVMRFGYRLRRFDQKGIAGVRVGIIRE